MSQAMFYEENEMMKQNNSSNSKVQHSTANMILTNEYKYRLNSFSNSIGQRFIGFIQRKFSRNYEEKEKHEFDDLTKIQ
jgi:hypothetical protein